MLKLIHFDSPVNALGYLEEQKAGSRRVVFRGEFDMYPTRTPSARRHDPGTTEMYNVYSLNLTRWVFDNLFAPHLEHDDGPYYRGSFVGCQDLLGRASSDHGYAQSHWQLEALFQHYGRKTRWLDLTFDPRVAIFFAAFDETKEVMCETGVGYVYYLDYYEIPEYCRCWPLIDLQDTSELFASIIGTTAERPRAQSAAALRCFGDVDFNVISFRRTSELSLFSRRPYFPDERITGILDACEGQYLEYLLTAIEKLPKENYESFIAMSLAISEERLPKLQKLAPNTGPPADR